MKKLLSLVLAVMMLVLPMASLAEVQKATISFELMEGLVPALVGGEEDPAPVLNQMTIEVSDDGDAANAIELKLGGESVLSIGFAAESDRVYMTSNLLGGRTISFNEAELKSIIARFMCLGDPDTSYEDALAQLDSLSISGAKPVAPQMDEATIEAIANGFDEEKIAAITGKLFGLLFSAKEKECSEADFPGAASAIVMSLTAEDAQSLLQDCVDLVVTNTALTDYVEKTAAGLNISNLTGSIDLSGVPGMDLTMYSNAEGAPVSFVLTIGDIDAALSFSDDMTSFNLAISQNGSTVMNLSITLISEGFIAELTIADIKIELILVEKTVTLTASQNGEMVFNAVLTFSDNGLFLSFGTAEQPDLFILTADADDSQFTLNILMSGTQVFAMNGVKEAIDALPFAPDKANAVALGALDEEGFNAYIQEIANDLVNGVNTIAGMLQ